MTISSFTLNCNACQKKKNGILKYVQLLNYGLIYLNWHLMYYLSKFTSDFNKLRLENTDFIQLLWPNAYVWIISYVIGILEQQFTVLR